MTTLITDHPAWSTHDDGTRSRVLVTNDTVWRARWTGHNLDVCPLGEEAVTPRVDHTEADELPSTAPDGLRHALTKLGRVTRVPNPDLWDAITTAVLRQVVRAAQARALYRRWCGAYGIRETPAGPVAVTPSPQAVLALPDESFSAVGVAFHRTALQAAAAAYLRDAATWQTLAPDDLVKVLDEIPRIGPWTAAATTADFTGDFSVYPHGDLAVRTWARRAAPDAPLPGTDRAFAAAWQRFAPNRRHLHALTLFTLAWGNHASSTDHDGVPADPT